jgi:DNA-binding transcriptional MocR family regulator
MSQLPEHPTTVYADLTPSERILYSTIRDIRNHKTNQFFYSIQSLSKVSGLSRSSIKKGLHEFIDRGIISSIKNSGRATKYKLCLFIPIRIKKPPGQLLTPSRSTDNRVPVNHEPHPVNHEPPSSIDSANKDAVLEGEKQSLSSSLSSSLNYFSFSSSRGAQKKEEKKVLNSVEERKRKILESPALIDAMRKDPSIIWKHYPELDGWRP